MVTETIEVLRIPGTLFPRGPYDETASYKFLNIVESGGSGYVCLQPCTGIPVTNTAYWFKFVFKGEKGDVFTYADLSAEQKAELVRDATAAAQAAASSAQSAADDAAAVLQKFNTIKAAIDAIDPTSTEGSIQTLAAKQGVLEAELDALGPKVSQNESNIENLQQEIDAITPITIEGDVTNAPDEEDITTDESNLLKLKDRPTAVNQKGYKILRKGVALSTQMADANTIYEVKYAFDLNGGTLTIPSGCTLNFDGGSLSNGTIVGNGTETIGGVFSDMHFDGTFTNESVVFGASYTNVNLFELLLTHTKAKFILDKNFASSSGFASDITHIDIEGNGYKITVPKLPFNHCSILSMKDIVFDLSEVDEETCMLEPHCNADGIVNIRGCTFVNVGRKVGVCTIEEGNNPIVENNVIQGTLDVEDEESEFTNIVNGFLFYNCHGLIVCQNNVIENIYARAICVANDFDEAEGYVIKGNIIKNTEYAGINVLNSISSNIKILDNTIQNTCCLGCENVPSASLAYTAAINVHGFKELLISTNVIHDCITSGCLDIDGLDSNGSNIRGRGTKAKIINNVVDNCKKISLVYINGLLFGHNRLIGIDNIDFAGSYDANICDNTIIQNNGVVSSPIVFGNSSALNLGNSYILRNTIERNCTRSDYNVDLFLLLHQSAEGTITIRGNKGRNVQYPHARLKYKIGDYNGDLVEGKNLTIITDSYYVNKVIPLSAESGYVLSTTTVIANTDKCYGQYPTIKSITIMPETEAFVLTSNSLTLSIGRTRLSAAMSKNEFYEIVLTPANTGKYSFGSPYKITFDNPIRPHKEFTTSIQFWTNFSDKSATQNIIERIEIEDEDNARYGVFVG